MKPTAVLIMSYLLLLTACGGQPTPDLPTVAAVPTETATPPPTETGTPTATSTATHTATHTATVTPTRTTTYTPTATQTASITPTFTLSPTNTPSPTDTATPTHTATATPVTASINSFEVSPKAVVRGQTVTLTWDTEADIVILEVLDKNASVLQVLPLQPSGQRTYTVPRTLQDLIVFSITAQRLDTTATLDRGVTVFCDQDWFFDDTRVEDEGCPAGEPVSSSGAYQRFEDGFMIYLPTTRQVYVLYGSEYAGSWVSHGVRGENPIPPEPDDDDLFRPQNQFASVWLDTEAPNGRDWEDEVGFGVSPAVQTIVYAQDEENSPVFYIGTANGFLFRFRRDAANVGFWERIP